MTRLTFFISSSTFSRIYLGLALGISFGTTFGQCTSKDGARTEIATSRVEVADSTDQIELVRWQADLLRRVEVLAADSLQGREFGTEGGERARTYLVNQFDQLGLSLIDGSRIQPFTHNSASGANVVGEIRSESFSDSSLTVLIGAHYDHEGVKRGNVYNGADDNASGTSLLLAIADTLTNSKLSDIRFIFVAFDAEEKGLVGAKAFIENNRNLVDSLDLMINFDMVSISDSEELYVAGSYHNPELKSLIDSMAGIADYSLLAGHDDPSSKKQDWTFSSDHGPFHRAKVPFLYFGVEDHEHYHKATDEYAVIDKEFYIRVADSFRQFLPQLESLL